MAFNPPPPDLEARRLRLSGQVQGVGFRPFVHRLADTLGIKGWVKNATGTVVIHAEGRPDSLTAFQLCLIDQAPGIARPVLESVATAVFTGHDGFAILASEAGTVADIHVPPDYFTCPDCLRELTDPGDRRHGYPFINCTQCGPRYTLITALPYDRPNTSMAGFPLCPACQAEYLDPLNRRFHAEPVACPVCGPHLEFVDARGGAKGDQAALAAAVAALQVGQVVAVKGIGGYHLMCDARLDTAVAALRARKPRPAKPLAVMFPADGRLLAEAAHLSPDAEALLRSPARPIVILRQRAGSVLSGMIAPGLSEIGCFLPYSPLHHLLLERFSGPLVATSGNLGGEPVLTDNAEAEARLARIADAFLHHNRPIVRPADDPVYRFSAGRARPLRLGRGVAPLELELPTALPEPVLALGSHMKNTVCLAWGRRAVISPHIGELGAPRSLETLARVADDLQRLYQVRAARLLLDRHPGYGYRAWARADGRPIGEIWHHRAHASALAWEHPEVDNWIVFAWDGVGLGEDGTLWGGEAFVGRPGHWRRGASLRPFRLPGGDQASRQPWRSAAALLWESKGPSGGEEARMDTTLPDALTQTLSEKEREHLALLHQAWRRGLNSPASSAAGRLFDAASALIGICSEARFEGEGPMRLEALAQSAPPDDHADALPLYRDPTGLLRADWAPLLSRLTDATQTQAKRAWQFHSAMANTLVSQALALSAETGATAVGLTGGVFQNRLLIELAKHRLEVAGLRVHLAERVPVNDAGVSFGQVVEYLARPGSE